MNGENRPDDALVQAQQTIARQADEIKRLQQRLSSEKLAGELREAVVLASTVGTIAAPVSHTRLLEMIVQTAAHVIAARSAALFLIDYEAQALTFEVALGPKAHEVKKFRVPLGHGIAGLVAVSGQPMAISDAQNNPNQALDIAQSVNYLPESILCVPLFYNDQVIGVLELLDKEGDTAFSAADLEALSLFANQAAVAIEQSKIHRHVSALLIDVLSSVGDPSERHMSEIQREAAAFAAELEDDTSYRRTLELARTVQDIVAQGENEFIACQAILNGFAEYLRSRPDLTRI